MSSEHSKWMKVALEEAQKAAELQEVPVGAVVVKNGEIVSKAHNLRETRPSATAHAEILAIDEAAKKLGAWRLVDCDLYVTLEPCMMCAGAIVQSRIHNLIFGANDPKSGAIESIDHALDFKGHHHKVDYVSGVLSDECSKILKEFFREKR